MSLVSHSEKVGPCPTLGMPLEAYVEDLFPVAPEHSEKPDRTIPIYDKLRPHENYLRKRFCYRADGQSFEEAFDYHAWMGGLPFSCFSEFSFDELSKVWYSADTTPLIDTMFHPSSEIDADGVSPEPQRRLVGKIENSMWRWGHARRDWNSVAAFYNALRRFEFGVPGFTVTFDHATTFHDRGYSRYARTYLDGAFGYLIHYKGEHVLTIGFSFSGGRRVLVSQVQLANTKGNRWLYKLPMPQLDYALSRMELAFPLEEGFALHLADGRELAVRIKDSYREAENAPPVDTLRRVTKFYSRPLANYVRSGHSSINQLRFHRLVPRGAAGAVGLLAA